MNSDKFVELNLIIMFPKKKQLNAEKIAEVNESLHDYLHKNINNVRTIEKKRYNNIYRKRT